MRFQRRRNHLAVGMDASGKLRLKSRVIFGHYRAYTIGVEASCCISICTRGLESRNLAIANRKLRLQIFNLPLRHSQLGRQACRCGFLLQPELRAQCF